MISIYPGKTKMREIQEKHWLYFKTQMLENWINKMNSTDKFRDLFFENETSFNNWFNRGGRSTKEWFEKQDERKFDRFKGYIIGSRKSIERLKLKLGIINDKKVKDYLIGQYENFRKCKEYYNGTERIEWGGVHLARALDIKVCPYCNRSFVDIYYDKDKYITKAQFDHFYRKEAYPYLALSLFNLVPSCYSCNHTKLDKDYEIVYPYDDKNGGFSQDAVISVDFYRDDDTEKIENGQKIIEAERFDIDFLNGNSDNFKVSFQIKTSDDPRKEQIKNSIGTFKLENLYTLHKDYIREIIKKANIYNRDKIIELYESFPELFKTKEEVIQMVLSNYIKEEDLGKRPLAKLVKDITDEFMEL